MNNFYVYGHYKPDGNIFYVGKGRARRAWKFGHRSDFWYKTVNKHGAHEVILLYENLSEEEAFLLEREEIAFWGRRKDGGFLINLTDGGEGSSGRVFSSEEKKKIKERMKTPEWKTKHKAAMKKLAQNPEWKVKNKEQLQKLAQTRTPEWKIKHTIGIDKLKKEYIFISPDNNVQHIHGLGEFCRTHGLHQGNMLAVNCGKRNHHKGWTKYIPLDNNHLLN